MLNSFDPRTPPGMADREAEKEKIRKRNETLTSKGRKVLDKAAETDFCIPVLITITTVLILVTTVMTPGARYARAHARCIPACQRVCLKWSSDLPSTPPPNPLAFLADPLPQRTAMLQVFIMGGQHRHVADSLHRPDTDELERMDDPISRCHLTDDYTVRNGKAVLRYNRRSQREEECSHMASKRGKVVAAVSDCPFLVAVYDKVAGSERDIVSSSISTSGFWEPRESGMIADLPRGSLIVDVGANLGWHTLLALSMGHTVVAFEPLAGNLELLEHSLCLNPGLDSKLTLHKTALSDSHKGDCQIQAADDNVGDGTLWCGTKGGGGWEEGRPTVPLSTLDIKIKPGTEIDLIKLDVEGHEMAVIKGGADLFAGKGGHVKPRYVVSEFSPSLIRQQGHDPQDMLIFFFNHGYTVMPPILMNMLIFCFSYSHMVKHL